MSDHSEVRDRVVVLVNSDAGAFAGDPRAAVDLAVRLRDGLTARGLTAVHLLADGADLATAVAQVVEAGAAAVMVAGGDGTVATVAHALCDRSPPADTPVAILPLGTANLLARDLRMPIDPDEAVAALAEGVVGRIDVGRVNGRVFLNNVVLGLFANVARQRERFRGAMTPLLWGRLLWRLVLAMRRYPRMRAVLATENGLRRVKTHAMVVADNAYVDRPGLLVRRDSLGRGALAIYVMRHRTPWRLMRLGMGLMVTGSWRRDADLLSEDARRLTVLVRRRRRMIRATVDGEVVLLPRRVSFRLEPAALRVWVPADAESVLYVVDGPARSVLTAPGVARTPESPAEDRV